MSKILVIVESPAKCNKIETILGDKYKVIASFGHLRQLNGLQSININDNFSLTFTDSPEKVKYIEKLRYAISVAKSVIIATDNDREGEAIGWHICDMFSLPVSTTPRIVFNEITETAILKAIANPIKLDMNLIYAQRTRQILDLLVGFTISPILWKCISKTHDTSLSAGRCQTPALRLIYDNQMDIQNSPGKLIYNTIGYFTGLNLVFELNKQFDDADMARQFISKANDHIFSYNVGAPKRTIKKPPGPLSTSALQQLASNELHLSPKDTMKCAQTLYEAGLITYMRTDSKKYSSEFIDLISKYIGKVYGDTFVSLNVKQLEGEIMKNNMVQEAHESIRPVNIEVDKLSADCKFTQKVTRLYALIRNRTLESCMASAQYSTLTSTISAPDSLEFVYKSEEAIFTGWKEVTLKKSSSSKTYQYLSALKPGQIMKPKNIECKYNLIELKTHYSEARLVQLLEDHGIGRPSTFASLIDKIQERKYVEKIDIIGKTVSAIDFTLTNGEIIEIASERVVGNEKGKLSITPLGKLVLDFLVDKFEDLFNYEYTKELEQKLDIIAKGNESYSNVCTFFHDSLSTLARNNTVSKFSLKIDDAHELIIGKYGPVVKYTKPDNTISFLPTKKDIDLDKLKSLDKIILEDIIFVKDISSANMSVPIGKYRGVDLFVKKGKYGLYANWGANNVSLSEFKDTPIDKIVYIDVLKFLEKDLILNPNKAVNLLRELSRTLSVRSGKYGDYIYHTKPASRGKRPSPDFLKLKSFSGNYLTCDKTILLKWIKDTYGAE